LKRTGREEETKVNPLIKYLIGTVHQLFIDFNKTYDSVRREVLYNILTVWNTQETSWVNLNVFK
jgi:hypothetical protein